MNFIAIGRGEILFNSILHLTAIGHRLVALISDSAAPEYQIQLNHFQELSQEIGIPILASSQNSEISQFLDAIDSYDIGISVNHKRLLDTSVLKHFPLGVLNFHGGDLPRYRGNACQAWAILNGERRVGATIHKMIADELDTGPFIAKDFLDIDERTKIAEIHDWMLQIGPKMFADSIELLSEKVDFCLPPASMSVRSHRCHERRPIDCRIDWSNTSTDILKLINASGFPYGGAFAFFEAQTIKIFDAEVVALDEDISAVPGQIVGVYRDGVIIACGKNDTLKVSEISIEGFGLSPANQLLRSTRCRLT